MFWLGSDIHYLCSKLNGQKYSRDLTESEGGRGTSSPEKQKLFEKQYSGPSLSFTRLRAYLYFKFSMTSVSLMSFPCKLYVCRKGLKISGLHISKVLRLILG